MSTATLAQRIANSPSKTGRGERIAQVRGKLSRDKFAGLLGVHRNTIIRYEQELAYSDAITIRLICDQFGVGESWLIRGGSLRDAPTRIHARGKKLEEDEDPFVSVPFLSEAAGNTRIATPVAFRKNWLKGLYSDLDSLFAMEVADDTMKGTIDSGDIVLGYRIAGAITRDAIYVLDINGRKSVRRIQLLPDGTCRVKCDNADYDTLSVRAPVLLKLYGVVCGVVHRF